jgi:hypothetical protein
MIPPWLNIGPDLFMEAAKAGDQMSNVVAAREQQARDTASQRNFMYDELRQRASEGEAARQVQYAGLANQQYDANLRANQGYAQMQQQMKIEDARRRDQGYERQLAREDRFNQNSIANQLALKRLTNAEDQNSLMNEFRGKDIGIRSQGLSLRDREIQERERQFTSKQDKAKFDADRIEKLKISFQTGLENGLTLVEMVDKYPEFTLIPGVKEVYKTQTGKKPKDTDAEFKTKYGFPPPKSPVPGAPVPGAPVLGAPVSGAPGQQQEIQINMDNDPVPVVPVSGAPVSVIPFLGAPVPTGFGPRFKGKYPVPNLGNGVTWTPSGGFVKEIK